MQNNIIASGIWVTMVTPFRDDWSIDYDSAEKLIEWYIRRGVDGIFAVCQSSEMFYLERDERRELARFVVRCAAGRVPVAVSGHVSQSADEQLRDVDDAYASGADAVVLVSNRIAAPEDTEEIFEDKLNRFISRIDQKIPLAVYECPVPYKRLMPPRILGECARTGRFRFIKDTSCNNEQIRQKIEAIGDTGLKLFNANAATFLDSLYAGAAGYSGIMANFHPELYKWVYLHRREKTGLVRQVSDFLGVASVIEARAYPDCAKYYLSRFWGNSIRSRCQPAGALTESFRLEVDEMESLAADFRKRCGISVE